jgi:polyferredoxin
MAQDNDITSTNGAPKEYWEARAEKEREQAKAIASARWARTVILLIIGGIFLFLIIGAIALDAAFATSR